MASRCNLMHHKLKPNHTFELHLKYLKSILKGAILFWHKLSLQFWNDQFDQHIKNNIYRIV